MRLGRLPHDPVALASVPVRRFGAIPPRKVLDRSCIDFVPGMFRNNVLPDCTAVAMVNAARAIAALRGYQLVVDPAQVPAFYAACVGVEPTEAAMIATDGAVALSVLERQDKHGFDIGPQALVGNHGVVPLARSDLAIGIDRFIGYWGITLHDRDMQDFGGVWDTVAGRDDGPVVGGHMVMAWDYTGLADQDTVRIGTWGVWQRATWRWVAARLDEAYGVTWKQLDAAAK